jgi:hypothetical protein
MQKKAKGAVMAGVTLIRVQMPVESRVAGKHTDQQNQNGQQPGQNEFAQARGGMAASFQSSNTLAWPPFRASAIIA